MNLKTQPLTPTSVEPLWTISEAAEYLGVSDDTARPLLAHLAIRLTQRTVRYRPEDVIQFVEHVRGSSPLQPPQAPAAGERAPVRIVRRRPRGAR